MIEDSQALPEDPVAGERSSRARELLVGVAALTLFGLLTRPLWTGVEVYTASDLGNFYLPIRDFYLKALEAGHRVTWFPYEFTGFYLHGEGQVGLLHPLNLAQYRWLPLETAFNLELARGYIALFGGVYYLLRRFALPRDAALFGAFLAAFPSFTLLHYTHLNIIAAAAHLPWLLVSLHVMLRPRTPARALFGVLGVVLLTASLSLLGHPQFVFITTAIEVFALLCVFSSRTALLRPSREEAAAAVRWGFAKALGFAAAGVALVPAAESLATSFRAAPPEGFTSDFNIGPAALVQLFSPYLFADRAPHENLTEVGFYLGAVPTVLLGYALARRASLSRWRIIRPALVLAAIAFWLSLGDWGLLYRLQSWLPVVGLFRAPARYVLVVELAVAVVAALMLAELARSSKNRSLLPAKLLLAVLLLPGILGVVCVSAAPLLDVPLEASGLLRWFGPAALFVAALLVVAADRGVKLALPALLALALLDVGAYGASFVARTSPETIDAFLSRYRVPAQPGTDRLHWGPPALTMKGFRLVGGYVAMTPDRVLDLGPFAQPLQLAEQLDSDLHGRGDRLANALRVSGVRWAIGTRMPEPLPRFRLAGHAIVSDDPNRDIAAIDVATTVLVDAPVELDAPRDGDAHGRVDVALDVPGEMQLLTNASGRRLLVVSESYHEGWKVEVDGEPRRTIRAYGDYMACVVGPGPVRVKFRFEPASLKLGSWITGAALCATTAWVGLGWVAARRRPVPA